MRLYERGWRYLEITIIWESVNSYPEREVPQMTWVLTVTFLDVSSIGERIGLDGNNPTLTPLEALTLKR